MISDGQQTVPLFGYRQYTDKTIINKILTDEMQLWE